MNNEISPITKYLFHKDDPAAVSVEDIEAFIEKYPYVSAARFLLAKKEYDAYPSAVHDDIVTAGLYFNNPLWFEWQLRKEAVEVQHSEVAETVTHTPDTATSSDAGAETKTQTGAKEEESPIVFQSYHTIDYFASQGIRLQQAELTRDKLGQQLKSFTEWLRSMKKLPAANTEAAPVPEDEKRQEMVIRNAETSIREKEVVTEAMAEVWAKQGNREKAIETYNKLSLLNPSKNAYFAAKIEQLKQV